MVKLRSKKLFKTSSKVGICGGGGDGGGGGGNCRREIEWELRPGGLLVQKREAIGADESKGMINVRVSTGLRWLHISISATATFGMYFFSFELIMAFLFCFSFCYSSSEKVTVTLFEKKKKNSQPLLKNLLSQKQFYDLYKQQLI